MSGIQDIPIRVPREYEQASFQKWFEGWVKDALQYGDTRNSLGVGILVTGDSDVNATYEVDSQNIDLAEGLETRALIGAMRSRIDELEISKNRDRIELIGMRKRIEELEIEVA